MFVGHALLAFALVGAAAARLGHSRERALLLGGVAAGFAAVPDVDIGYALVGVVGAFGRGGPLALAESFWSTGNVLHRGVTHSAVLAVPAAGAGALAAVAVRTPAARRRTLAGAGALAAGAVPVVAAVAAGALAAVAAGAFVAAVVVVGLLGARRGVTGRETAAVALVGLVSHPFGDLFTGQPPPVLYPLPHALVAERVALHPDPTLHLLAAFGVELAVVWAALGVYCRLRGDRLVRSVAPRAALGAGYVAVLPLIPAPTLELSYPFVFSVLAVGVAGAVGSVRPGAARGVAATVRGGDRRPPRVDPAGSVRDAAVTGVAAVTCAWLVSTVAYALM